MPKTNRDGMKRIADQALNDLERSLSQLADLRNIYAGSPPPKAGIDARPDDLIEPIEGFDHPEHRQTVEAIAAMILQAYEVLKAFRLEVM